VSKSFNESLKVGKVAESKIAKWLMERGNYVTPAYQIIDTKYSGPQLFGLNESFVTPDMLVFSSNGALWIEAKHKTAFTWHRNTSRFVTGIDLPHWEDYLKVSVITKMPCWLMFNHLGGQAKDSPPSPSGLFCGEIQRLKDCKNHEHPDGGKYGMIYWAMESLKRFGDAL